MKKIPKATYLTVDQIEAAIRDLSNEAMGVPPDTERHRAIMKKIAQLKIYAEARRWIAGSEATVSKTAHPGRTY